MNKETQPCEETVLESHRPSPKSKIGALMSREDARVETQEPDQDMQQIDIP